MSNTVGVLEGAAVARYGSSCATNLLHSRRFNYSIVNKSPSMTRRDSEVVPSPLVEQRQEDGLRHHLAGTLSTDSRKCSHSTPRENYVRVYLKHSGCARSGLAGVLPTAMFRWQR